MIEWPVSETLDGFEGRWLGRISDLLVNLEQGTSVAAMVYAPREWMASEEQTRTEAYRRQSRIALEEQAKVSRNWTRDAAVPGFDLKRAAGVAGQWNYLQPFARIDGKEKYRPPRTHGVPDLEMLKEWFGKRTNRRGQPLLEQFDEPKQGPNGWVEFPSKTYRPEKLPTRSKGPKAWYPGTSPPEWETYFHGCKMEAAYAIISDWDDVDGGLAASGDKTDSGQRYNKDARGVYFHGADHRDKAMAYGRWCDLFGDGTYVRVHLEVVVDRNHSVKL